MMRALIPVALFLATLIANTNVCTAQEPSGDMADSIELFGLSDAPAKSASVAPRPVETKPTIASAAELRQARALYRSQQREARIQRNLWMGYEPLRPNWSATPMTTSRYGPRTIYVPIYVRRR